MDFSWRCPVSRGRDAGCPAPDLHVGIEDQMLGAIPKKADRCTHPELTPARLVELADEKSSLEHVQLRRRRRIPRPSVSSYWQYFTLVAIQPYGNSAQH